MKDRRPGAPGQYKAVITATELQKMQTGEQFTITMTRDDQPIVEGTPYSKAAVLPDELATQLCPDVEDPTPADALAALQNRKVGVDDVIDIAHGGTGSTTATRARANIGAASSKNLLDNWYFADPVCQRVGRYATFANGATTIPYYSDPSFEEKYLVGTWTTRKQLSGANSNYGWLNGGTPSKMLYYVKTENVASARGFINEAFCIDRWYFEQWSNTNPLLELNDGYLTLSCTDAKGDTNTNCIKQTIVNPSRYSGKTVTFSVKFKGVAADGDARIMIRHVGVSGTKVASKNINASHANSILSVTTTLQEGLTHLMVVIGNYANNGGDGNFTIEMESAKLELGSISTLANDAPPKKTEQLLECQRYFVEFFSEGQVQFASGATNGTTAYASVYLPVPLYDGVDATVSGANINLYPYVSGTAVAVTGNISGYTGTSRNWIIIHVPHEVGTSLPAKAPCNIRLVAGGYVAISAEI